MKKIVISILCILFSNMLTALGTLRVESIKELPATDINISVKDADGKWASVLTVKTELKGLGFQNVSRRIIKPAEYNDGKHEYRFYMNDSQRVVEITHADYELLEVRLLADFGIEVKGQRVYEIELAFDVEVVQVPVIISCNQSNADVFIDGLSQGKTQNNKALTVNIGSGSRIIRIEKDGFASQEIQEDVSMNNNSFTFILTPAMPAAVSITTTPSGAKVYIDDLFFGDSPVDNFYDSGTYAIKVEKQNYETIEERITITEPETQKHYEMVDIRATLTIKTNPKAIVKYDGKDYTGGIEALVLLPQTITFKIEQEFCETINETYTLNKGENKFFELYPANIAASLTIKTHPKAIVKLKGKEYIGGIDNLILIPQTITFRIEQEFCETIEETYTLKKGESKIFDLNPDDISAYLTIKTHPAATVKFNNESYKGGVLNYQITPQVLNVEVEMLKADPIERVINLKPKSTEIVEMFPEIKTGSIQVAVIPKEAEIKLIGDAGEYFIAEGRKNFVEIPIGKYNLKLTQENYITHEEIINLKKDDSITRSIKLEKANYVFKFSVNARSERIEELDFEIEKDKKVVYSGKGKKQISFSEAGEYDISITKGKDFGFSKNLSVIVSRTYNIGIVNQVEIERKNLKKNNLENLSKIYRKQTDTEYYLRNPLVETVFFANAQSNAYKITATLLAAIFDKKQKEPAWVKSPIFNRLSYSKIFEEEVRSDFYGGMSISYSWITSQEFGLWDVLSFNIGYCIRSKNHKRRYKIDSDFGFKIYWITNPHKNNSEIYYSKNGNGDETIFTKWSPGYISTIYEQYLFDGFFGYCELGMRFFTNIGGPTKAKWYYKINDVPIQGNPDNFVFDYFVPYFGFGIGY